MPKGVAQCEGIHRKSSMTKCVALMNEAGMLIGKGICHNISLDLIIDKDNQPLGDDRAVVQITQSLSEHKISSDSLFQLRLWHIMHVVFNGASLYDHEQLNIFNLASTASCQRSHVDARPYESSRERKNSEKIPKKVVLLNVDSIANVSTKSCCSRNCLQPFPRNKIEALKSEMHVERNVYRRKHRQLDVLKQIQQYADGKEMITLEGMEVCPKA